MIWDQRSILSQILRVWNFMSRERKPNLSGCFINSIFYFPTQFNLPFWEEGTWASATLTHTLLLHWTYKIVAFILTYISGIWPRNKSIQPCLQIVFTVAFTSQFMVFSSFIPDQNTLIFWFFQHRCFKIIVSNLNLNLFTTSPRLIFGILWKSPKNFAINTCNILLNQSFDRIYTITSVVYSEAAKIIM